jgi:hypothetical protein
VIDYLPMKKILLTIAAAYVAEHFIRFRANRQFAARRNALFDSSAIHGSWQE